MITVVFVCEDQADFRQAAHLADRALQEKVRAMSDALARPGGRL